MALLLPVTERRQLTRAKIAPPDLAERYRREIRHALEKNHRSALGQFLTPPHVSRLMASMPTNVPETVDLLDPGAGVGALVAAFVTDILSRPERPRRIRACCIEIEPTFIPRLRRVLRACEDECHKHGVDFQSRVEQVDFIDAAVDHLMGRDLFASRSFPRFTHAILNPPYKKLHAESRERQTLRLAGVETSNYYTAFLWLSSLLLESGGEIVSITPRSFCNGPYFKPFRMDFLTMMSLRRLHVFESRSAAFVHDDVLQENVIVHAVKGCPAPSSVRISSSTGEPGGETHLRRVAYRDVVFPENPQRFIHLESDNAQPRAKRMMRCLTTSLDELGVSVSTGRVVDFRAKAFLRRSPGSDTAPLIYPCHFNGGFIHWPKENTRKPNAIFIDDHTRELLVTSGIYLLVKRFTTKEERRRIVACIYDSQRIEAALVGFENHLNYFHRQDRGLSMILAKGLAAFLNSTIVDLYFRQFSGHTQVNATDLRALRYPQRIKLERLGGEIDDPGMSQEALDMLVESELF